MPIKVINRTPIFDAIDKERDRQDRLHPGTSQIPDGTGIEKWGWLEKAAREQSGMEETLGKVTHATVLLEEVAEALAAENGTDLETELTQVAAVAVQWIEKLRARKP